MYTIPNNPSLPVWTALKTKASAWWQHTRASAWWQHTSQKHYQRWGIWVLILICCLVLTTQVSEDIARGWRDGSDAKDLPSILQTYLMGVSVIAFALVFIIRLWRIGWPDSLSFDL